MEEISYPGIRGDFVRNPGSGEKKVEVKRRGKSTIEKTKTKIIFDSTTLNSSVKKVEFSEDEDEIVQISIFLREEDAKDFREYLQQFPGLYDSHSYSTMEKGYWEATNRKRDPDLRKVHLLAEIIFNNNNFIEEDRTYINKKFLDGTLQLGKGRTFQRPIKMKNTYPGPSGTFVYSRNSGNWSLGNVPSSNGYPINGERIIRTIGFHAKELSDSFVKSIQFYGTEDEEIFIGVAFGVTEKYTIQTYFSQFPSLNAVIDWKFGTYVQVTDQKYVKLLTRLILENNEFSLEDQKIIDEMIFQGTLSHKLI